MPKTEVHILHTDGRPFAVPRGISVTPQGLGRNIIVSVTMAIACVSMKKDYHELIIFLLWNVTFLEPAVVMTRASIV
jgi:hypothetical protein